MNLNFLARRNVTIEAPLPFDETEASFEAADTQPFTPIRLQLNEISLRDVQTLDQFCGCLVAYRPDNFSEPQIGHVIAVEETKFGRIEFFFEPENSGITKWRDLGDFQYAVWS